MMFDDKPSSSSSSRGLSPPTAHSSSRPKRRSSPFRSPLDLALAPAHHGGGRGASAAANAALDLHAALNNIPKAFGGSSSAGLNFSTAALASITTPPAVPPPSSKFWDTPPPTFSSLTPPPLPPPSIVLPTVPAPKSSLPLQAQASGGGASSTLAPTQTISSLSAASASTTQFDAATNTNQAAHLAAQTQVSKYSQLLSVLEEMSKDIRPTYSGSKSSAERLKRGIIHARILVREALMEVERASRQ